MRKKRGFSLVEVMVAAVMFSLVILGLTSVFIAVRKQVIHYRERMTSAQLGKFFLDHLQVYVRQDTWDQAGNQLATAGSPYTGVDQWINNRKFSETHAVTTAGTSLRRVISTISWTE